MKKVLRLEPARRRGSTCPLDLFGELDPLYVLLRLQHGLNVTVALQQALAVQVALFDVLPTAGVDPFQQCL